MASPTSANPAVPPSFLRGPPPANVSTTRINFTTSAIPQYSNCYTTIIDDVFTPSECATLLRMAAASTVGGSPSEGGEGGEEEGKEGGEEAKEGRGEGGTWARAMVNMGGGKQAMAVDTRNCGRIIYDDADVAARIWARVAPLVPELAVVEGEGWSVPPAREWAEMCYEWGDGYGSALHPRQVQREERWRCTGVNERLRFLRYEGGEYFRPHCDGAYVRERGKGPDEAKPVERSMFTLHLYLNDGEEVTGHEDRERRSPFIGLVEGEPEAPLKGGATTFHGPDDMFTLLFGDPSPEATRRRMDVVPRVGRVLLFQQRNMLHSGDDVLEGVKYTMRTDVMYVKEQKEEFV